MRLHAGTFVLYLLAAGTILAQEPTVWDFEKGAGKWKADDSNCGVVVEPGAPANHAYQIIAVKPHHTRVTLEGSAATPNFLVSLRVKVLAWEGEPPAVYVYGRCDEEGFRALSMTPANARVFAYYGQGKPSISIGALGAGFSSRPEWVHLAFACFDDYVLAKVWPASAPEPGWQVEGSAPGLKSGEFAIGVWTSPKTPSKATVLFDDVQFMPLTPQIFQAWGIQTDPTPPLPPDLLAKRPAVFETANRTGLVSERTAIAFDLKSGRITNLVDVLTRQEFVSPDSKAPLFLLVLTKPYEGVRTEVSSREFRRVTAKKLSDKEVSLFFDECSIPTLRARVVAALDENGAIRLRIAVSNESLWSVAGIAFSQMPAPAVLGGAAEDDFLLLPWAGGAVLPSPGKKDCSTDALYPGIAFAQFYAHYDRTAGLYVGAHDPDGHCKRFRLQCSAGRHVSLTMEHLFPEVAEQDAVLPYDVVVRTFQGDWRDAADIYKAWAVKQPWCARRLDDRDDIPQFLKEGAGILITGIQNPQGRAQRFGENFEKLPDILDAYRDRTGLKHMVFVPYGWENRGTWAGINYLPAVPSNEVWRKVNETLKGRGHRTAFLTSGFWWVVKRQKTSDGAAFDDTADFERRRGMCIAKPDGSAWTVDWYNRTEEFGSWRGLSTALCHGSREARDTLKKVFLGVAALGVPLISFDQEIGGGQSAPCYSKSHGHPPGYGDWMWTGLRDLCAEILKEGKPVQPELGLFMENESELAIPYMATYWSRQFGEVDVGMTDGRGIGLFSYLYHEYVTCIGAACVQGQGARGAPTHPGLRCYILANNLVRGLIPGPFMHDVPLEAANEWQAMKSRAYFAFCRPYAHFPEYLILGRTLRPLPIECEEVPLWFWRQDAKSGKRLKPDGPPMAKVPIRLPAVTAGSFEAPDGTVAAFVVNATAQPRQAVAVLPPGKRAIIYHPDRTEERRVEEAGAKVTLRLEPFGVRVLLLR